MYVCNDTALYLYRTRSRKLARKMQAPHTLATPPRKKNWLGPSMLMVGIAEGVGRPMGNKARAPSGPRGNPHGMILAFQYWGRQGPLGCTKCA